MSIFKPFSIPFKRLEMMIFFAQIGEIMAKVAKDIVETRPREIIGACRKLYRTMAFQEITLKDISAGTSLSRPSIYNYFQTKEEIFLALLGEEYDEWCKALEKILNNYDALTIDEFAAAIANSINDREMMLKIQCMNLYEIEEHSRAERLLEFKYIFKRASSLIDQCLAKFFPSLCAEKIESFHYIFFPFLNGVYPYAQPTAKQSAAMKSAGIKTVRTTVAKLTQQCVKALLSGSV